MAAKTAKVKMTGTLKEVSVLDNGKYEFVLDECCVMNVERHGKYTFLLVRDKALVIANGDEEFPINRNVQVEGRLSSKSSNQLNHVRIFSIDGTDPRAWAEQVGSVTVPTLVQRSAKDRIRRQQEAQEAVMADRAPPEPKPNFNTPKEAFDRAMFIVSRQVKLKNPKLTKTQVFQLRDALNMLKDAAGL